MVRRGLASHVVGRTIIGAEVLHPRALRRYLPGPASFQDELSGAHVLSARRRGKFLWLELPGRKALLGHLGMSGQLLVQEPANPRQRHLRIQLTFAQGGPQLRFVDQRTFGWLTVEPLVADRLGHQVPRSVAHIGLDPLDKHYQLVVASAAVRSRKAEIKRVLLDQTIVSGIGNIYADEALWRAGIHSRVSAQQLSRTSVQEILTAAHDVMLEALAQGGTSFDALYVNVNGASGYFDRSLAAYGQQGQPCHRCQTPIIREAFMNRSSYSCPACQRPPRG